MSEQAKTLVPKLRFPEFLGAEGWQEDTLGNICINISSGKDKSDFSGTYQLYGSTGVIGKTSSGSYEGSYILVARVGANAGLLTKANGKFGVTDNTLVLFLKNSENISFIFHTLDRFGLNQMIFGSGQPLITGSQLKALSIRLPSPVEQQKIANCLSSIDELITAQTNKIAALKDHKKGLMQQLFASVGETVPKLRFPEFQNADEWEAKPLAKVCDVLQGYGFPEALQGKHEGKYPFCKVSDISRAVAENGGKLAEATNYIGDDELLKLRAKLVPKGAAVFAKIGEALRLNRRAYVKNACLIDNNATGLKAIKGVAVDYFVYLLSQLIDLNDHCGGAVPAVNKTTLEAIEVILPGLEEQQRVADCLSSLDDLITTQTQKLVTLKDHKKGLMQQLFPSTEEVNG